MIESVLSLFSLLAGIKNLSYESDINEKVPIAENFYLKQNCRGVSTLQDFINIDKWRNVGEINSILPSPFEYERNLQEDPLKLVVETLPLSIVHVGYIDDCSLDYNPEYTPSSRETLTYGVDSTGIIEIPVNPNHVNAYQGGNYIVYYKVEKTGHQSNYSSCVFGSDLPAPGDTCYRSENLVPLSDWPSN